MNKIAKFQKVSYAQFEQDWLKNFPHTPLTQIQSIYDAIEIPKRATKGSAGYDFFSPISLVLKPQEEIMIPTGICASMQEGWVLVLVVRSSLGSKYRLQLNNTMGVIDSDYVHSDNEGHIFLRICNDNKKAENIEIQSGQGVVQGIFLPFGICEDDCTNAIRNGGFGSTDQKEKV